MTYSDYRKMKRRKRIKNNYGHKRHLKNLANNSDFFPSSAYAVYKDNDRNDDNILYYKRAYASDYGDTKFIKRQTNKRIRKMKYDFRKKSCDYRKTFDYWWTLT